jgi:hypothetical protein
MATLLILKKTSQEKNRRWIINFGHTNIDDEQIIYKKKKKINFKIQYKITI